MDRLEAMQAFVSVAELKGFSRAARSLKASPVRVTRLVASLEAHLGVELLQRTTRAVSLTAAGSRYLASARDIVAAVGVAEARSKEAVAAPSGRFVVTAPVVFGRLEVAPLFSRFLSKYPAVRGELILVDRVVNLVEEGIDVAVRIGTLDDSALKVRAVGATRRVVVASPAYLEQRGRPRRLEDLASHATIMMSPLSGADWQFVRDGRSAKVKIEPAFTTNNADAAIAHCLRGGGLAMVLAYQVADAVAARRLVVVLSSFEPTPRPIQLVYSASRQPSSNVRAFVDLVAKTSSWAYVNLG